MYDAIVSFLVSKLRNDVTSVANRVMPKGSAYSNTKLPRIVIGYNLSLNEETQFIGNKAGYSSSGNVMNTKIPVEIIASSAKEKDQVSDSVLTSLLSTNRPSSTANILDIRVVAENNVDEGDDEKNPNVFRRILDVEIVYERT